MAWSERYRPVALEGIVFQDHVVEFLQAQLRTPNTMPHLLFHGPPGSGKTSTAFALCHDLFRDAWRERLLELNASHERGINIIREKVQAFAQVQCSRQDETTPAFKIIIFDEADAMTKDAQTALRFIIEKYALYTRFVLICNRVDCLIEPLQSRCVKLSFQALDTDAVFATLQTVAAREGIKITTRALSFIATRCDGDLRQAIHLLQEIHNVYPNLATHASSSMSLPVLIEEAEVVKVADLVPVSFFETFLVTATSGNMYAAVELFDTILQAGYPIDCFFQQLQKHVLVSSQPRKGDRQLDLIPFLCVWCAEAVGSVRSGASAMVQLTLVWCLCRRVKHWQLKEKKTNETASKDRTARTNETLNGVDHKTGHQDRQKNFLDLM